MFVCFQTVIDQGGLNPGGLNFDAKVRRESTDVSDMFIAHIGAMDAFARGLKSAVRLIEDQHMKRFVDVRISIFGEWMDIITLFVLYYIFTQERYSSFTHGLGKKVAGGTATFEECEVRDIF